MFFFLILQRYSTGLRREPCTKPFDLGFTITDWLHSGSWDLVYFQVLEIVKGQLAAYGSFSHDVGILTLLILQLSDVLRGPGLIFLTFDLLYSMEFPMMVYLT